MFGPSGKLYQPPAFRARLAERKEDREIVAREAQRIADAMARVNEEKRQPEPRPLQTAV